MRRRFYGLFVACTLLFARYFFRAGSREWDIDYYYRTGIDLLAVVRGPHTKLGVP
jgi:hypothetical protein